MMIDVFIPYIYIYFILLSSAPFSSFDLEVLLPWFSLCLGCCSQHVGKCSTGTASRMTITSKRRKKGT